MTGGFAEIGASAVTVLAERAIPTEELTGTVVDDLVAEARSLVAIAPADQKDAAEKLVNDLLALRGTGHH